MAITVPGKSDSLRLFHFLSLRQLYWATIILPLVFVGAHHFLMIGPMHPIFHEWYGFAMLLVPLAIAVWAFSHSVFRIFQGMQQEIGALHEEQEALVVEQERQHLAHEMHDGLAQVLGFVNLKARIPSQTCPGGFWPC